MVLAGLMLALAWVVDGGVALADPPREQQLNEAFPLGGGQVSTIRGQPLRLHFVSVLEDSRCPPTLLCYWPGQAKIAVDAQVGDEPATSIVLDTRPGPNPGGRPVSVGPFTIQLQDLDPSPRSVGEQIPTDEYAAKIVVWRTG
jgi:hypothetical protein